MGIKIAIVEDNITFLKQIEKLIKRDEKFELVGTATTGTDAIRLIEQRRPELILLDLSLPDIQGTEVIRQVREKKIKCDFLILTVFEEEKLVLQAVRAGASGYLLKGTPYKKIKEALLEIHSGGSVIQPNLARTLLNIFMEQERLKSEVKPLSKREKEILSYIAKGLSNKEVAEVLGLSSTTVRTHLEHIYEKLNVTNRVEAVTEGIRQGLIDV
ncbi:MAG: response regulator [Myxococcota bacterium]